VMCNEQALEGVGETESWCAGQGGRDVVGMCGARGKVL
jgi:hypothetical protein